MLHSHHTLSFLSTLAPDSPMDVASEYIELESLPADSPGVGAGSDRAAATEVHGNMLAIAAEVRHFLAGELDAEAARHVAESPGFVSYLETHFVDPLRQIAQRLSVQTGEPVDACMGRLMRRGESTLATTLDNPELIRRLQAALTESLAAAEVAGTGTRGEWVHRLARLDSQYTDLSTRHGDGVAEAATRALQDSGCWHPALAQPDEARWPDVRTKALEVYHHLRRRFDRMFQEHALSDDDLQQQVRPALYQASLILAAADIGSGQVEAFLKSVESHDGRLALLQGALGEAGYAAGLPIVLWGAASQAVLALSDRREAPDAGQSLLGGYLLGLVVGLTDSIAAAGAHRATRERRFLGAAPDREHVTIGERFSREAGESPVRQTLARGGLMFAKNALFRVLINTAIIGCFPQGVSAQAREALDFSGDAIAGVGAGALAERTRRALRGGTDERAFRLLCQRNLADIALKLSGQLRQPQAQDGWRQGLCDFGRGALHSLSQPSTILRASLGIAPFVALWRLSEQHLPRWSMAGLQGATAGVVTSAAGALAGHLANVSIGPDRTSGPASDENADPASPAEAEEAAVLALDNLVRACVASTVLAGMVMWSDSAVERLGDRLDRACAGALNGLRQRLPAPLGLTTLLGGLRSAIAGLPGPFASPPEQTSLRLRARTDARTAL